MRQSFDTIVLGLGGIGSAALYWLSRRVGRDVLGLEQFELGHVNGGSHDHSRIIRLSYHTTDYVDLAKSTYTAWATVEEDAEEQLIVKTGGLDLSPPNAVIPINTYSDSMAANGIPFESLDAAEVMYRWPQFKLTDDITALYQTESGIAPAAKANATHIRMARKHGATVYDNLPVTDIKATSTGVEVTAGGTVYHARHLIISAGAWSNHALAHLGHKLPLTVTKEQVNYFNSPHVADFTRDRFPVWIWMDEPSFYGFPIYGENAVKVAQDAGGEETTVETRTFDPDLAALKRVEDFTKTYLPTGYGPILYTKTCLYTMPPDRDFVLDHVPDHPNVSIGIGAGHAYKFASLLGKILSELALDGTTPYHIAPFSMNRPILWEENPEKSFMV